jgi:hypothetical protein
VARNLGIAESDAICTSKDFIEVRTSSSSVDDEEDEEEEEDAVDDTGHRAKYSLSLQRETK